jgi:tetratricopeptide (TPR) repeat protein
MTGFDEHAQHAVEALIFSDPKAALALLRDLATKHGKDLAFMQNYGSRLIDIGRDLRDESLIREGILETEKVLNCVPPEFRSGLEINIASAHHKLHLLNTSSRPLFDQIDSDELSIAKEQFNQLQKKESTVDAPTRKMFLIEFGNCLSGMGRFYEAIRLYENALEIEPNNSVAIANLALSFRQVALIADDIDVLREASDVFGKALLRNELDNIGGLGTQERISRLKSEIDKALLRSAAGPLANVHVESHSYRGFCKRAQLLLNFCFHSEDCHHNPSDTLSLAVAEVIDENRLIKWVRAFNEMKQQFAVARLLLFESIVDPSKSAESDDLTFYLDLSDHSVYGVRSGKLKIAYEAAFNIFDKLAFFLNDYLQLGIRERDINFRGIWKDTNKKIRPELLKHSSDYLRALYELSKELPSLAHFGMFTDVRNMLTHRYFVLHTQSGDWRIGADGDEYHAGYKEFSTLTLQILGLAKAALVYLIAFVRSTESQKATSTPQFVRPVKYTRGDHGPAKAEI